jgi:hypothetical protein
MNAHIPVILLAEDNPKDVDLTSGPWRRAT